MKGNRISGLLIIFTGACLFASPALAGVKDVLNTLLGRTQGLKERTEAIRDDARDMANDFRERGQEIRGNLRDQLIAAQDLFQETVEDEKAGLDDFLNGGGCPDFYGELAGVMDDLKHLSNQLIEWGLDGGVWGLGDDAVDFFTADRGFELPLKENGNPTDAACRLILPDEARIGGG